MHFFFCDGNLPGMEDSDCNKVAEKPGHQCFRETTTGKEDMKLKLRKKKKKNFS